MWWALQDLYNLCLEVFAVLYLPRSRPVSGAGPAKCCQLRLDRQAFFSLKIFVATGADELSLLKPQRNQHIQNCFRWEWQPVWNAYSWISTIVTVANMLCFGCHSQVRTPLLDMDGEADGEADGKAETRWNR